MFARAAVPLTEYSKSDLSSSLRTKKKEEKKHNNHIIRNQEKRANPKIDPLILKQLFLVISAEDYFLR